MEANFERLYLIDDCCDWMSKHFYGDLRGADKVRHMGQYLTHIEKESTEDLKRRLADYQRATKVAS